MSYDKWSDPEICLAAVNQDGWALEHVEKQTPELILATIRQNPEALRYVKPKEVT